MKARSINKRVVYDFKSGDRVQSKVTGAYWRDAILIIDKIRGGEVQFIQCQGICWHKLKDFKKVT